MAKKSNNNFDIKKLMDASGSYKNLIYGVITVVVLFIIIFLGIRTLSQNQGDVNDKGVTINESSDKVEYEVAAGDTLWSISEKVYGTGFNWQIIAEANGLTDPNNLEKGKKIIIPELTPTMGEKMEPTSGEAMEATKTPEKSPAPTAMMQDKSQDKMAPTANDKEYTVKKGDNLWNIAIAEYGDGYKWVDIARANKLSNPNIIHAGNNFVIPR